MKFLKEANYYSDLYDLHTIQECLRMRQSAVKDSKANGLKAQVIEVMVYYYKGGRYKRREGLISEWIQRDEAQQEKYDNTAAPSGIYCEHCNDLMQTSSKALYELDVPLKMLFFFDCPSCTKRKAYFEDSQQYIPKPHLCEKCSSEVKSTHKRKGNVVTTTYQCTNCDYKEIDFLDFAKRDKEQEQKEKQERKLLKKYRSEFCMNDEEGQKYISHMIAVEQLRKMDEERKAKAADPRYQKAKKLKKLTIVELKKLLSEKLEHEKYLELKLGEPEIGKYVIVPFTIQEAGVDRKDSASEADLNKFLRKTLKKTNWRIMSDGVSYRMGYLSGRLKGYEKEEDLVRLIK